MKLAFRRGPQTSSTRSEKRPTSPRRAKVPDKCRPGSARQSREIPESLSFKAISKELDAASARMEEATAKAAAVAAMVRRASSGCMMPQDLEMLASTNPDGTCSTSDSETSIADVAAVPYTPNDIDGLASVGKRKKGDGLIRGRRTRRSLQDLPPDSALRKALSTAPEGERVTSLGCCLGCLECDHRRKLREHAHHYAHSHHAHRHVALTATLN